mmetsp:Transcript_32894/g.59322  ORF Transcript_32894/g.59322 Transcript_32894/m.59322 type:complete len:237 (-) Transcript_32894:2153-2863(-)
MHMLRCVLQVAEPTILILGREYRDSLETPPSDANDNWIIAFEDFLVPTMLFEATADQSHLCFLGSQATNDKRHGGIERIDEFRWDTIDSYTTVNPLAESFIPETARFTINSKLVLIASQSSFLLALECLDILTLGLFITFLSYISLFALIVIFIKRRLLRSFLLGIELPELNISHTLRCRLVITIFNNFSIRAIPFTSFKVLKFVKHFFLIPLSVTPIASNKLITDTFNQAILSFI